MKNCDEPDLRQCFIRLAGNACIKIVVMCSCPLDYLVSNRSLGHKSINRARDPKTGNVYMRTSLGYWKAI